MVENSLDAGSRRIQVQIKGGGIEEILVVDDGQGIAKGDVQMAFQRYATSKISTLADLNQIRTLGFRGEALASIAVMAKVDLTTRTADSLEGTYCRVEGGSILHIESCGCPVGTRLTVSDLFFNTPARRKFIQSSTREAARIGDIVERLALTNPAVSISLIDGGRKVLATPGNNRLQDVVGCVYGLETANRLLEVEILHPDGASIRGVVGDASLHRATRKGQTFVVNGRYILHRGLANALEAGYTSLLPRGRYPVAVLFIDLPPEHVDANVHPAKLEVRLVHETCILQMLQRGIEDLWQKRIFPLLSGAYGATRVDQSLPLAVSRKPTGERQESLFARVSTEIEKHSFPETAWEPLVNTSSILLITDGELRPAQLLREDATATIQPINKSQEQSHRPIQSYPDLEILAQLGGCYILAQSPEGLVIIDQHAAHERVIYERLMEENKRDGISRQNLIVPLTVTLTREEFNLVVERMMALQQIGFLLEYFGEKCYIIRGAPSILTNPEDGLRDILADWLEKPEKRGWAAQEQAIISLACQSAVKANRFLHLTEMISLVEELTQTKQPWVCPHGRPTTWILPYNELHRRFLRT